MYWNNELTITMNTNTAATAAMMTAKEVLANTSIEEYCKGEFAQFADCLKVTGNEISCTDEASVRCETYELVLPEILKAIADQGYEFHGNSYWDSSQLLEKELIAKVSDRTYWKTEIMNGRKTRTPIQQGDEEMSAYFSRRSALISHYQTEGEKAKIPAKELKNFAFSLAIKALWEEYHCCYYTCKTFLFSAWEDDEEPFFQEVVELTQDIMYTHIF